MFIQAELSLLPELDLEVTNVFRKSCHCTSEQLIDCSGNGIQNFKATDFQLILASFICVIFYLRRIHIYMWKEFFRVRTLHNVRIKTVHRESILI